MRYRLMHLQLEQPKGEAGPSLAEAGDDSCLPFEFSNLEPRALEVLNMLNHLFDCMSQPATCSATE